MEASSRLCVLSVALAPLAVAAPQALGAMITFESPAYLATGNPSNSNVANWTNPLAGQNSWSTSTSNSPGQVFTTSTSGEYTGGQAARGDAFTGTNNKTYIGANSAYTVAKSYSFDVQWAAAEAGVGGWIDENNDNVFQQAEAQFHAGIALVSGTTVQFGIRPDAFGATRVLSGVSGTTNHWYRVSVQIGDTVGGNTPVTLAVRNLTTAADVDFDAGTAGTQNWTTTLTTVQFGGSVSDYDGLLVRSTGTAAIDNIDVIAVPEPAALAALAGASLGLASRRRRRA
jgi:hypothetical protein